MPDNVRQMIYGPDSNGIPSTAYAMHAWQLDAWERQSHPNYLRFTVRRGTFGNYDGYVMAEPRQSSENLEEIGATFYIRGWLSGRDSMRDEHASTEDRERLAGEALRIARNCR